MESTPEQIQARWADIRAVAEHYTKFTDFYWDCSVELLGFEPTEMQMDIASYVANSELYAMVQAQRGEAKTTITGCYAVWCLIQDPTTRVLIVSAGTPLAKQISTWIIQIINGMDICAPLRPDKSHDGVRTSVEAYDVHHDLKGAMASPSLACLGITSTSQGYRADLLIADDVESAKNSRTQAMREQLKHLTKDFTSINAKGRILYLGTPQTIDSVYNDLPARGFTVRIWPGRYPTVDEETNYGGHLAPIIARAMYKDPSLRTGGGLMGDRGQPTDPGMMSEEMLTKKEMNQGKAYFNLQYMLDTELTDADRFPLKLNDLMFYSLDKEDAPSKYTWTNDPAAIIDNAVGSPLQESLYRAMVALDAAEFLPYSHKLVSIDPAGGGQNGDETGIAVLYVVNGYICVMHVTGVPGGTAPSKLDKIVDICRAWDVHDVLVEKNFGHGAFAVSLQAAFMAAEYKASIEEVWSSGQKELRIADALDPVIGSHKLVVNSRVMEHDVKSTLKYPIEHRPLFQFLFQLRYLTRERGSLIHEDRLEAVSQGVTHLLNVLKQTKKMGDHTPTDRFKGFRKDHTGKWRFGHRVNDLPGNTIQQNLMDRFRK